MGGAAQLYSGDVSSTNSDYKLGSGAALAVEFNPGEQVTYREPGTISLLSVNIIVASSSGSGTFTSEINGSAGNCTVSVGVGLTGYFQDTSNSDAVAAGDELNYVTTIGASQRFADLGVLYTATANVTSTRLVYDSSDYSFNFSDVKYVYPAGIVLNAGAATESLNQLPIYKNGTIKNAFCWFRTNSLDAATTITARLDGADTAVVISIASGLTGFFEDTTHSASVTAGEKLSWVVDLSASSSGGAQIRSGAIDFQANGNNGASVMGASRAGTYNQGTTYYSAPVGYISITTTEAEHQLKMLKNDRFVGLGANITANTLDVAHTYTLRKNGADGNLTFSVASTLTGQFADSSNKDSVAADDLVTVEIATPAGSGSADIKNLWATLGPAAGGVGGGKGNKGKHSGGVGPTIINPGGAQLINIGGSIDLEYGGS